MARSLLPYEETSPFLRLPAETRLQIYSYIIPDEVLNVDLCTPRRPELTSPPFSPGPTSNEKRAPRPSPISSLVSQFLCLDNITRSNGLHLLLVSRRTRSEIFPLLSRLTVVFHCPKCFEDLLANLSHGLGVGVAWMKHVEIYFDCGIGPYRPPNDPWRTTYRGPTASLARFMVMEAMQAAQRTAWLYYGRMDLTETEKWKFEPIKDGKGSEARNMGVNRRRGGSGRSHWPMGGWYQPPSPAVTFAGQFGGGPGDAGGALQGVPPAGAGWNGMQQGIGGQQQRPEQAYREWVISGWFDI